MPVLIDSAPIETERLGLSTVGQLLSHVSKSNRLVVNLLIDGREPNFDDMATVRQGALKGHTLFLETVAPREIAADALDEVERQMAEADRLTGEAVDLLQKNQLAPAMQKLSGCFSTWHSAQDSVTKTAQLMKLKLEDIETAGQSLSSLMTEFSDQLRSIRGALESRDYTTLGDVLTYETPETTRKWRDAMGTMRAQM